MSSQIKAHTGTIDVPPLQAASTEGPIPLWRVLWDELLWQYKAPRNDYSDVSVEFQDVDIRNVFELEKRLTDPEDLLAQHLLKDRPPGEHIRDWLNALLASELYEQAAFERVQFRNSTRHFLKRATAAADLKSKVLNRHLLEDAFPDQLRSLEDRQLKEAFQKIQEGRVQKTAALCFSGGGIRSATFSLGVIQALARGKLLSQFDYLSTVSGGGYIGSWLSSWIHRHPRGLEGVEGDLGQAASFAGQPSASALSPEPEALRHLRSYSKYLSPRTGLLSADVWTLVAILLRNLFIHWAVFLPLLFAVLAVPRLCVSVIRAPWLYPDSGTPLGLRWLVNMFHGYLPLPSSLCWLYALLPFIGLASSVWALTYIRIYLPSTKPKRKLDQGCFLWHVVAPLVLFAISITTYWAWNRNVAWSHCCAWTSDGFLARWINWLPFLPFALSAAISATIIARRPNQNHRSSKQKTLGLLGELVILLAAGFSAGRLLLTLGTLQSLSPVYHPRAYICLAASLFLVAFLLVSVVLVGLASRWMSDDDREWLARAGGWVFSLAVCWTVLSSLVLFGPNWILTAEHWIRTAIASAGGAAAAGYSLYKGFSSRTPAAGNDKGKGSSGWTLQIAVVVAAIMIVVWISWVTGAVLGGMHSELLPLAHPLDPFGNQISGDWPPQMTLLFVTPGVLFCCVLLVTGWAIGLDWAINLNEFSLHSLYRNRLIRAYLGASRHNRRPNPFTGFDPRDDLQMCELKHQSSSSSETHSPQRPIHVVNASLNLVHGKELAWQQRKASSFAFTPFHCGNSRLGYRQSNEYGAAVSLGTAVTISGAAVSPNMGYHSSGLVAFLLTFFNIRLGWWLGNPSPAGTKTYRLPAPRSALWHLTRETLGYTDDQSTFVYLSDGGHFENLAFYSMVERRCHLIVVVDAECDPKAAFEGLGNAIRKIQVDLGVPIQIDHLPIYSRQDPLNKNGRYCAIGVIQYSKVDPQASDGTLIYMKPALCSGEPIDIRNYASGHPEFPHETTADQWFDETQFESYRKLGEHVARTVFEIPEKPDALSVGSLPGMIQRVRERWYSPSPYTKESFSELAIQVDRIFELIRKDEQLRFLDAQIYPEWGTLMNDTPSSAAAISGLPPTDGERRAGFYACNRMIQLMESVYLGLNLEEEWDHLDNRGWMNLFRHWTWADMFRVTYAISAGTYGARFQSFCRRHLRLEPVDRIGLGRRVSVDELPSKPPARDAVLQIHGFNFFEIRILESLLASGRLVKDDQIVPLLFQIQDSANDANHVDFTFGFAVLGHVALDKQKLGLDSAFSVKSLRCMRVQDHLRRMGLGRMAMCRLVLDPDLQLSELDLIPMAQLPADFPVEPSPQDYAQITRLYTWAVANMLHNKPEMT